MNIIKGVFNKVLTVIKWVNKNKGIANAINIFLVFTVIIYLFFALKNDFQLIISSLSGFKAINVIISGFLYGINFYIFFEIWRVLLTGYGFSVNKTNSLKIFSSTYLAKFIPSPILFYVSRISQLEKVGITAKKSIAITALEFVFQVIVGISLLSIINLSLVQPKTWIWIVGLLPCIIVLINPKIIDLKYFREAKSAKFTKSIILFIFVLQFIPWIFGGLFFFFIIRNFFNTTIPIDLIHLWEIWILANITSMIGSYLLGGLGLLREFTLVLMLQKYFPSSIAIIIAATIRVMLILFGIFWAVIYYLISVLAASLGKKQ